MIFFFMVFYGTLVSRRGDYKKYIDLFEYCYGEKGVNIAQIAD